MGKNIKDMTEKEKGKFRITKKQENNVMENITENIVFPFAVNLMLDQSNKMALRLKLGEKITIKRDKEGLVISTNSKDSISDILKRESGIKENTNSEIGKFLLGNLVGRMFSGKGAVLENMTLGVCLGKKRPPNKRVDLPIVGGTTKDTTNPKPEKEVTFKKWQKLKTSERQDLMIKNNRRRKE